MYAEKKNEMFVQIQFVCNIVPRDFLSRRFIMQYSRTRELFSEMILAKKVLSNRHACVNILSKIRILFYFILRNFD